MIEIIIKTVISFIKSFIRDILFKAKKAKADKKIAKAKTEAINNEKISNEHYDEFTDLYARYKSRSSDVRPSARILCPNGGESEESSGVTETSDKGAGRED